MLLLFFITQFSVSHKLLFFNRTQRKNIVLESCGCSAFQLLQAVCANHDLMHRVCILGWISIGCYVCECFCAHRGFCKGLECCAQRQLQSRLSFSCHFYWHEKTNEEEEEECPDLIREVVRGSTDDSSTAACKGTSGVCSSSSSSRADDTTGLQLFGSSRRRNMQTRTCVK